MRVIVENDGMNFETFGGRRIFRPRTSMEFHVRQAAETDLRQRHSTGTYVVCDEINEILHDRYAYFDKRLKGQLPKCASLEMLKFVFWQYDQSCEVERQYKAGLLSRDDRRRWEELGPFFRRSIKYLAECITMAEPGVNPQCNKDEALKLLDECWICAELLVDLSIQSSQTFMLFPDQTTLDIVPPGDLDYIILEVDDSTRYEAFQQRMACDTAERSQVITPDELFGADRVQHYLDGALQSALGFSFSQAFNFSIDLTCNAGGPINGFDVPFVREQDIVELVTTDLPVSEQQASCMLDGLTLRSSEMHAQDGGQGRLVWKPKQEYRAFARPFFEFPHESGKHLVWSRQMAKESLVGALFMRLTQGHVPLEWETQETKRAIAKYTASITKDFEDIVLRELESIRISTGRFHRSVGSISIPPDVGEIDCLAYVEEHQLLLVADSKYVTPTTEPATFRDDLSKFLNRNHNYRDQIMRKAAWVANNLTTVVKALTTLDCFPNDIRIRRVTPVLVTYCPTFASLFMEDVACVSIAELIKDIKSGEVLSYPLVHSE